MDTQSLAKALAAWNQIMEQAKKSHEAELARAEWERS